MTHVIADKTVPMTDKEQEEAAQAGLRRLGLSREILKKWAETDDEDFITAGLVLPYMTVRDARILEMRRLKNQYGYPLTDPTILERNKGLTPTEKALAEFWDEERDWLSRVTPDVVYGEAALLPLDRPRELWIADLKAAQDNRDGLAMLRLLTMNNGFPKGNVAHFRSNAFQMMDYPELALFFRRIAAKEFQDRTHYQVLFLCDLSRYQKLLEARELSEALLKRPEIVKEDVISIVSILMLTSRLIAKSRGQSREALHPYAQTALQTLEPLLASGASPTGLMLGLLTLGAVYNTLERRQDAISAYSLAIQQNPRDGNLYSFRGHLLRQTDIRAALADYERAIRLHTKDALPYLVIAELEIEMGNVARSKRLCKAAYVKAGDNKKIQALAMGILALAELISGNRSMDEILKKYKAAVELDPESPALQKNYEAMKTIANEHVAGQTLKVNISDEQIKMMIQSFTHPGIAISGEDDASQWRSPAFVLNTQRNWDAMNRSLLRDAA